MIRHAFLFRVEMGPNLAPKYIVKIARQIDYVVGRVGWMDDKDLPVFDDKTQSGTLVPDIDITEEHHEFDTEELAMIYIAQHYKSELEKVH